MSNQDDFISEQEDIFVRICGQRAKNDDDDQHPPLESTRIGSK